MPIDPRMVKWDEAPAQPQIDPRMVKWDEPPTTQTDASTSGIRGDGFSKVMDYNGKDATGGFVRGAGSIGATLMRLLPNALGGDTASENADRRARMDGDIRDFVGSNPESSAYQTNKLLAEVAGTSGIGGAASKLLGKIPGAAANIPGLLDAIKTGGMSVNGAKGLMGAATRVTGGAINGALTAGAINPEDTGTGALLGGAFPAVVQGAGKAGELIGRATGSSIPVNPVKLQTARESMDAGYIIPPSQIKPSFGNRTIESLSGKHETAQLAATRNQAVTENLVRKELGIAPDVPMSFDSMKLYRSAQHSAGYEPLRNVGTVQVGPGFNQTLDDITKQYTGKGTIPAVQKKDIAELVDAHKSSGFDSGDAVDAIRILREDASDLFKKGDSAKAKATKAIADAYEGALDSALQTSGNPEMLSAYREARKKIAQSATVEKAIREGAGTLDARVLARELQKGKPLTGGIKTAAQFANTFDKAAQPPHLIGSPGVNNLRASLSALSAGAGGAVFGPGGIALGAANYIVPPMARARMFSSGAQQGLLGQANPGLLGTGIDELLPLMYRTNPVLAGGISGQ